VLSPEELDAIGTEMAARRGTRWRPSRAPVGTAAPD
jgi:hypothetical protein